MKKLQLENLGVQELNTTEVKNVEGGKQAPYHWSGTDNPIIYVGEAIYNLGAGIYNLFN